MYEKEKNNGETRRGKFSEKIWGATEKVLEAYTQSRTVSIACVKQKTSLAFFFTQALLF